MSRATMRAVLVEETGKPGDWNKLVVADVPRPEPAAGEVLVQVEAFSVNRADLLQRRGLYPPPPGASPILGLDCAGYVVQLGAGAGRWHVGDRVFAVVAGGGYGRYVVIPEDHLIPVPENLSFTEAAAAAEVFLVAFLNLFLEAGLQRGETLLLHGGGSGVGTAAVQLARESGACVIVTAATEEKIERCLRLGAWAGIEYKSEDFAWKVRELTDGRGVDVVLDWIGAPYLGKHLDILKPGGRLVVIGLMGGHTGEITLAPLLTKRLKIIGSVLRSRSWEEKAELVRRFRSRVLPLLASGSVKPVVDSVFKAEEVETAHRRMQEGGHFGKIVLTWSD